MIRPAAIPTRPAALVAACLLGLAPAAGWAEAGEALRTRAESGDAEAQFELGRRYLTGAEGTPEDAAEATRWFRRAAEQGERRSQFNLAMVYTEGRGVEPDEVEAVNWLMRAADRGHSRAMALLAERFWEGRGVGRNLVLAQLWLSRAAALGSPLAQARQSMLAGQLSEEEQAAARRLSRIQRERIRRQVPAAED